MIVRPPPAYTPLCAGSPRNMATAGCALAGAAASSNVVSMPIIRLVRSRSADPSCVEGRRSRQEIVTGLSCKSARQCQAIAFARKWRPPWKCSVSGERTGFCGELLDANRTRPASTTLCGAVHSVGERIGSSRRCRKSPVQPIGVPGGAGISVSNRSALPVAPGLTRQTDRLSWQGRDLRDKPIGVPECAGIPASNRSALPMTPGFTRQTDRRSLKGRDSRGKDIEARVRAVMRTDMPLCRRLSPPCKRIFRYARGGGVSATMGTFRLADAPLTQRSGPAGSRTRRWRGGKSIGRAKSPSGPAREQRIDPRRAPGRVASGAHAFGIRPPISDRVASAITGDLSSMRISGR
jgi:hypothetical protein